jgi:hypothetical protein
MKAPSRLVAAINSADAALAASRAVTGLPEALRKRAVPENPATVNSVTTLDNPLPAIPASPMQTPENNS